MSENVQTADAETVAWGSGPALPPQGPKSPTWQAPAVIGLFLVVALIAAGVGIALGSGTSKEDLVAASKNAPKVGVCRTYDAAAAAAETNDSPVVPCSDQHSAQTFAVVDALPEPGEAGWTEAQILDIGADVCSYEAAAKSIDLTFAELAATRLDVAFFTPSADDAKDGARWMRCDLMLTDGTQLSTVAGDFEELAAIPGAFAQCSGANIGQGTGAAVKCTDSSSFWAAVGTVPLGELTSQSDVDAVREQCREVAIEASQLAEPNWSAVLPRNSDIKSGVALCALRADQWKIDRAAWPAETKVGGAGDTVSV